MIFFHTKKQQKIDSFITKREKNQFAIADHFSSGNLYHVVLEFLVKDPNYGISPILLKLRSGR